MVYSDRLIVARTVPRVQRTKTPAFIWQEHEVSFYAKKCGVTPAHFSGAIRKASGHSPLAIITGIIIMNAKAQLKSTRLPVKEIAFSLGFNNLSFFNKYFRKHVEMTPQEYREC